jgi:hypothetical protein
MPVSNRRRGSVSDPRPVIRSEIQPHYPFPFVLPAGNGPALPEPEGSWKVQVGAGVEVEAGGVEVPDAAPARRQGGWFARLTRRG